MREVTSDNFGLLIAYVIPGFVALWGVACFFEPVRGWLSADPGAAPTVGGFLFGTLAAIATGLIINAIRWHLVDPLHYASGVPAKNWDYSQLPKQVEPFRYLVAYQFRYYECYANMMVAIAFTFAASVGTTGVPPAPAVVAFFAIQLTLWSASRRTLVNYHQRIAAFLGDQDIPPPRDAVSANSIDLQKPSWYIRRSGLPHRGKLISFLIRRRPAQTSF